MTVGAGSEDSVCQGAGIESWAFFSVLTPSDPLVSRFVRSGQRKGGPRVGSVDFE